MGFSYTGSHSFDITETNLTVDVWHEHPSFNLSFSLENVTDKVATWKYNGGSISGSSFFTGTITFRGNKSSYVVNIARPEGSSGTTIIPGGTFKSTWSDSPSDFVVSLDCSLCNDTLDISIIDKRHSHNNKKPTCKIDATSGTTITVSAHDSDGTLKVREGTSGSEKGNPHTFTGYSQGSNHTYYAISKCSNSGCKTDKNKKVSNSVSGKTWAISCYELTAQRKTKQLTFEAHQTPGTLGNATQPVVFELMDGSGNIIATSPNIACTANGFANYTFTGLSPGVNYVCKAHTVGILNASGVPDNVASSNGSTSESFKPVAPSGDYSATTWVYYISWDAGGSEDVTCSWSCSNGQGGSLSNGGGYAFMSGLTPGATYSIYYTITDKEGNTSSGSGSITTHKASFYQDFSSTKIIQFSSYSNHGSDSMEQSCGGGWEAVEQKELSTYNNLGDGRGYTIRARIYGCYAFNSSGGRTSYNDSEISKTVYTQSLSLSGWITEEHQHSIVTGWQAYADGSSRDYDPLDGTAFSFTYMVTKARKTYPYQRSEVIAGPNGNTTGSYSSKRIYSNNLTWYYCEYEITATVTDGYNTASDTVIGHTTFPFTWVFDGGRWHKAMPHIYASEAGSSGFIPAAGFVYRGQGFNEPNGE